MDKSAYFWYDLTMILVISSNDTWAAKRLAEEAVKAGVKLRFITADKIKGISLKPYTVLYVRNPFVKTSPKYLPDVVKLAKRFKLAGKKVVDAAIAHGNIAQGKWVDYRQMMKADLPIPNSSKTHGRERWTNEYPFILKWVYGMKGKGVFLARDKHQLAKISPLHPKKQWLVQEFIKADYEYKVITVGFKALPKVSRFRVKQDGFGIDFSGHQSIKTSSVPKVAAIAEQASKLLGRQLAKVDILQKGKKFYILEVNRFPGLEWFEKLTKFNATKAFLEYLQK
ncbi:MAG: RimK family alpha-L-glutamate ligase [Candidatus Paceibacterales bacterium]